MSNNRLSAVIITRNEQENIVAAIESLRFAGQIVVADTASDDRTVELAREAGAEVYSIPFQGYGLTKNRALEFCRGDWIFSMDADERVSPELAESIVKSVGFEKGPECYQANRLTYFLGKPVRHSGWFPDYVVRLFKKGHTFSEKPVHESIEANGIPGRLDGLLYHYSYKDLDQYLEKLNRYTTLNAGEMYKMGKRSGLLNILLHAPATFFKMYIFRAGFLDGINGLLLALLSSYQVFIKYAKLRELSKNDGYPG